MFNYPITGLCSTYGHVTNGSIANFPYINVLPMMMTNYGGDIQLTTIPPYAGYNTSLLFNGVAQQTYGTTGFTNSPFMTADLGGIQAAGNAMAQSNLGQVYSQYASQFINTACATIDNAIKAYESKIADSSTTDEQKKIMEAAVKDLKAKKDELEKMKTATDMDPGEAYTKSKDIKEAVDKIIRDVNSKLSGAAPASSSSSATGTTTGTGTTTDSGSTTGTGTTTDPGSSTGTGATTDTGSSTGTGTTTDPGSTTEGGVAAIDNFEVAVLNDTDTVYKAMAGLGTDDSDLEEAVEVYSNSGHMLELMLCYNNKYGDAKGESFIEAFMDDEDHNEACDMLPKIVNSLVARAKAMGVYDDEFRKLEVAVTKQVTKSDWSILGLGAVFSSIDDGVVCESVDRMVEILGKKAGSRYATVKKES